MLARLRRAVVRPRREPTIRRRPGDAVRIVLAAALLVPISFHAGHPTAVERSVSHFFATLPKGADTFFLLLYDLASLWVVGVFVVVVLLARRWRLARDIGVAAALAWVAARATGFFLQRNDVWHALHVSFEVTNAPRYPMVRVAMAVAVVVVAAPALTRGTRWLNRGLLVVLAFAALYLGKGSVNDLIGALLLGWGVAACVRLAFGTSSGRPTAEQVTAGLARIGVAVSEVRSADDQPVGRAIFFADHDGEPLRVVALGRDEADAQLLSRAWRFVAYRDAPSVLLPTRGQQVDYEAYVSLVAYGAGARVPKVVASGSPGPVALLAEELAAGVPLFEADPAAVTDAVLADLWAQVERLGAVHVAHGKLDGRHLLIDGDAARVVDFRWASIRADSALLAHDVAEALAATSAVVGPDRAVRAARRAVDRDRLAASLSFLQPAALSGWTHDALGGRKGLEEVLEELRTRAAAAAGVDPPELRKLHRVEPRTVLMTLGTFVAIATLLSRVGNPETFWHTIRNANWGFVVLGFVLGLAADAVFGITFLGNVPTRVPIWPSIELQTSMSFSNLAVPVGADAAIQVRFLQRVGLDFASAVAAGGLLSSVSEIAVQVTLFFVALWLAPNAVHLGRIDTSRIAWVVLGGLLLAGVALAVMFSIRRLRRAVVPPLRRGAVTLWQAMKSPGRVALLVGGNVVTQCLYAASLLACLAAFGHTLNFWTVLALNIGVSTIASLVPIPGGGNAVRSIGLAGLITGFGVPAAAAAAGVLTNQLVTTYLPAIPGWFATRDLINRGYL